MQPEEIMQRVRRLEIKARRLVAESFSGEYHSSFKGQGLDFDDFREYQHGDEPRFIDWNVSARMNHPFIRQFREERELPVIIAIDLSASSEYGSEKFSKREISAELAALLGFSATHNNDKVGLLLFAQEPILYLPPAKGHGHILRIVREILATETPHPGTSISEASRFLIKTIQRKALLFFISDFIDWGFEKPLATLARKHDLVALRVFDPIEKSLPNVGKINLRDAESGHQITVNTSNSNVRMGFHKLSRRYREGLNAYFKKHAIDSLQISTAEDYLPALHRLFKIRAKRRH